ncbi:MAG TPA: ATP-binding cassette domain-containing protein [Rhodocyclaceae bacterium]
MFPLRLDCVGFHPDGRPVLDEVDLTLDGDGITVLLGPNGAGKSVLLRVIAGLQLPDSGSIDWAGDRAPSPGRISMVFQNPLLIRASVADNVALSLRPLGVGMAERARRIDDALARVGLSHRRTDAARLLSGGEKQRLALARCWASRPQLLILDEPTASLDPTATDAVETIIREIRTDGAKILMTTHNLAQASRLADDVVFIDRGRVCEHAPAQRFFAHPQSAEGRLYLQGELPWRITFDD